MSIEKAFVARLKATASTVAGTAARVYPQQFPQGSGHLPGYVFSCKDKANPGATLASEGGYAKRVFQLDGYSDRAGQAYQDIKDLEAAAHNLFGTKAANVGAWAYDGGSVWVQFVKCESFSDDLAAPASAEETGVQAVSMTVTVVYTESLPTGT